MDAQPVFVSVENIQQKLVLHIFSERQHHFHLYIYKWKWVKHPHNIKSVKHPFHSLGALGIWVSTHIDTQWVIWSISRYNCLRIPRIFLVLIFGKVDLGAKVDWLFFVPSAEEWIYGHLVGSKVC